jgi:predicted RNA-binding protein
MSNESSLSQAELNDRIRILEDNIRQLIEQAAAASGEQNESRIADRLSQQNEELEKLTRERDARLKK